MEHIDNKETITVSYQTDSSSPILIYISFFCLQGLAWYAAKCFQNPNGSKEKQINQDYEGDDLEYMKGQWKAYEEARHCQSQW